MSKNNIYDFLIILFLHIAVSCIPFSLFISIDWLVVTLQILGQICLLIFDCFFVTKKTHLAHEKGKIKIKYTLLAIPFILLGFSNAIYSIFDGELNSNFNLITYLNIILTLFVAINEEIIFRFLFLQNYEKENKFVKVLVCSLIFGLSHLTHFFSSFDFSTLLIPCYTFFLGIILGATYYLTNSVIPCMVIHFSFNVFNSVIFNVSINNYFIYILVSVIVGLVVLIYLLLVMFIRYIELKKNHLLNS